MTNPNEIDITTIPNRIWFVHVNNQMDTTWDTRSAARARKRAIATLGSVTVSSSPVVIGTPVRDLHS
jgi:hypothetical protein